MTASGFPSLRAPPLRSRSVSPSDGEQPTDQKRQRLGGKKKLLLFCHFVSVSRAQLTGLEPQLPCHWPGLKPGCVAPPLFVFEVRPLAPVVKGSAGEMENLS